MILSALSFYSESLGKKTEVNVFLPAHAAANSPVKVLWLLHGMGDDHSGWLRYSVIEGLAEEYNIGLVMPNADLSFYVDMAFGGDYFTYISDELPQKLSRILPLSVKPEDNYIAGISMGGYGAFHIAMNCAEKYNAAVSLSGPMRIDWINRILTDESIANAHQTGDKNLIEQKVKAYAYSSGITELLVSSLTEMSGPRTIRAFKAMFGIDPVLTGNRYDLFYLAERLPSNLKLLAFCGEQDYHYSSNLLFEDHAAKLGLKYNLITGGGSHTWLYWNGVIPMMMEKLFGPKNCFK